MEISVFTVRGNEHNVMDSVGECFPRHSGVSEGAHGIVTRDGNPALNSHLEWAGSQP